MSQCNKNKNLNLVNKVDVKKKTVKELVFDSLILEMSKDKYELYTDSLLRVCETTGKTLANIRNYWSDLKQEIPDIFSNYPELTKEQKEILIIKTTAFEKKLSNDQTTWTNEEIIVCLQTLAEFYHPYITKKELFGIVGEKINKTQVSIQRLWYNRLRNSYHVYNITSQEKEIIAKFTYRKYDKTERQKLVPKFDIRDEKNEIKELKPVKTEFCYDKLRNHPVKEFLEEKAVKTNIVSEDKKSIRPEDIASKEFLEKFNIPFSNQENENLQTNDFGESEYIFRKISENEYEVLKGVVTVTKEFVEEKLQSNKKVTVLKETNQIKAKNYL